MVKELKTMRKIHIDNTRNFKADLQKKLLEFRKKAAKVEDLLQHKLDQNNSTIFGKEALSTNINHFTFTY